MRRHIMGLLEGECTVCLCPKKSSLKLIVSYPQPMHNKNEKLEKIDQAHVERNNPAS